MNSGSKIKELQNTRENKRLLAAQRQTYTDAKQVDFINACICLLVPLGVTVVQAFLSVPSGVLILIWAATVAAGICLPKQSERLVGEAASMQQRFDSAVFGIKFENLSRDDGKVASQADRYYKHRNSDDDRLGLDDWYSVDIEGMRACDAIAKCQRQNTEWSKRLFKRSLRIEVCFAVLVGLLLYIVITCSGADPLSFFFFFSVIEWQIQRILRCRNALKRVEALAGSLSSFDLSSKNNIIRVQEKVFEYRKASYLVPDSLYGLFKRCDEKATAS